MNELEAQYEMNAESKSLAESLESFEDCDELEFDDCYLDRNGNCASAGTEWCDFECPYRS